MAEPEWYRDGLAFQCTRCGNCCTGPPGYVWFTPDEGHAIAQRLGLTPKAFRAAYARRLDGRWSLAERETPHGHDCIFLDRSSEGGTCSIYEDRPAQCRTWPFWPENLRSQRAWESARRATPCPGMNTGPLVPLVQIRIQRDATPS